MHLDFENLVYKNILSLLTFSGCVSNAAPIPPFKLKPLGQPMFTSIPVVKQLTCFEADERKIFFGCLLGQKMVINDTEEEFVACNVVDQSQSSCSSPFPITGAHLDDQPDHPIS